MNKAGQRKQDGSGQGKSRAITCRDRPAKAETGMGKGIVSNGQGKVRVVQDRAVQSRHGQGKAGKGRAGNIALPRGTNAPPLLGAALVTDSDSTSDSELIWEGDSRISDLPWLLLVLLLELLVLVLARATKLGPNLAASLGAFGLAA
ncbi:MAG: hypothetical protein FRX49_06113 [Trebouxia sp. A1-2]|nr:MAG: hypothetical protein FRX49_06113 [Trebouxia sp. A1-2]